MVKRNEWVNFRKVLNESQTNCKPLTMFSAYFMLRISIKWCASPCSHCFICYAFMPIMLSLSIMSFSSMPVLQKENFSHSLTTKSNVISSEKAASTLSPNELVWTLSPLFRRNKGFLQKVLYATWCSALAYTCLPWELEGKGLSSPFFYLSSPKHQP